jgi:hypothetical protein
MLAQILAYYLFLGLVVTALLTRTHCRRLDCSADEFVQRMAETAGYGEVARRGFRCYAACYYTLLVVFWPLNLLTAGR